MKNLFLTAILTINLGAPAFAQDVTPRHGIAMHGSAKYASDYKHFDYVNPDAPKGGTLKLSAPGTFDSLNPYIVKGTPAAGLRFLRSSFTTDSLMEDSHDEPFTMYGLLAETIEMPDDRSWVAFNLRPQAKWHDGKQITAHDVVWTFNTFMEQGTPFFKAYYGDVKDVVATSDARVKFTFKHHENAELPLILGQLPVLPKHYWEKEENVFGSTSLTPPLGSGPYKITHVDAGRSITYERAPEWWGKDLPINKGRYNFDKITYDYYRDDNVALEAFFSGEYDVRIENTSKLWESGYNVPAVQNGTIIKSEISHGRPAGMQAFVMNVRRPVFQDINVRKALAYAFDFEWSNKQFAFGKYTRTNSYFANSPLA
ncbi:MAG: extracellular solute-binding protein, partial [Bdellovibrionales bacterium]